MNDPVNFIDPSGYITQKEIAMYNQGKLSQDVYNLLVDLGNRWANAKTEAAKDEIHNLAEQFRNNGYRYQDLSAEANNQLWANGNEMKEKMKFLPYSGPSALALAGAMWYDYVDNNGKWDYKVKPASWMPKKEEYFVMYGKLISRADFGNINYGYTGTALGIMPTTLYKGAGYVQTRKLNDNPNQYYGDSEVDFYNVKKGIEMANAAGYKGIFELPLNLIF